MGLIILGVLIVVAGALLYIHTVTVAPEHEGITTIIFLYSYPYQTQGLILLIAGAGIAFVGLGFYIGNWKAESMVIKQSS
jgi:hypothetical protein